MNAIHETDRVDHGRINNRTEPDPMIKKADEVCQPFELRDRSCNAGNDETEISGCD